MVIILMKIFVRISLCLYLEAITTRRGSKISAELFATIFMISYDLL